ncbi:5-formyltetrahydrofolate cyclo-ligase [Peribacillus kribbensis]|uniref:5-formyltetrahydrofolate cyclo-ligase n=1 Tax=Peribacillus kribbensis TaxID=356658 RepID=UPI00041D786C|nr:5-formyltetrahydrofolate cyclo-ligase [Peribacillus kribbensis]
MEKPELRKAMKTMLKEKLDGGMHKTLSKEIAGRLYEEEDWQKAECIGITLSNYPEADTYQIIEKAWECGKKVAVPKCLPVQRGMDFRMITDFDHLETVYYGLKEPIVSKTDGVLPGEMDLLFVPGLAFTKAGFRLGYGGGYYDRFLKNYTGTTAVLAFDEQILDELPVESHDQPVSLIITPSQVMDCGR